MSKNPRIKALAKWQHQQSGDESESFYAQDMRPASYDKQMIQCGSSPHAPEYLVLTDREADKRAADYIKDSLWAFRPSFLAAHSKFSEDVIARIIGERAEDANDDVRQLIKNLKHLIADAIRADGRGHFLSHYDGEENEVRVGSKTYYIYRHN